MRKIRAALALSLITALACAGEKLSPTPVQPWEATDGLPAARQGTFPVMMPKYEGVDQLLVLSSRWVIVVTTDIEEVIQKANELSKGQLFKMVDRWEKSEPAGNRPDWVAYKARGQIYRQFAAQAREAVGERRLDAVGTYSITSDDPAYTQPAKPKRVTRLIVSLGQDVGPAKGILRGILQVYYGHYSYLELPSPLQQGKQYTITVDGKKKVTFVYDETRTVSRAIKVNQVGYLPGARKKYAYLGAFLSDQGPHDFSFAKAFKVVDVKTGSVVHTGEVKLRDKNSRWLLPPGKKDDGKKRPLITGEDVYELDLGGLTVEGNFFITIPGVGRSWTFRHARDAYSEAFYTAVRGLFHQRCGIALKPPHTAWKRIACHKDPIYESEHIPFTSGSRFNKPKNYQSFDVYGGSIKLPKARKGEEAIPVKKTENPRGGWHDAADWDRNITHYSCVFDMLNVCELFPKKFTDNQLNIPESGNGIPDILDEVEFGIEIWKRSMDERGAVSGMVETWTHPKIDDPRVKYAFSQRTRWSSLIFAAAAAQYALLVKPYSAEKAEEYEGMARKAYAFGNNPGNSLGKIKINARRKRGKGPAYHYSWEEKDSMVHPFLLHARLRLAKLTGDKSFLKDLAPLTKGVLMPYEWTNSYKDYVPWMYFDIPYSFAKDLPGGLVKRWRDFLVGKGREKAGLNSRMPYRCSWPRYQNYHLGWGASDMTNYSRAEWIAHALAPNDDVRESAIQNADYMFGANPMGMCWTTGMGYVYPIDIQHANSERDGIMDPVPGISLYGVTGGWPYHQFRNIAIQCPKGDGSKQYVNFVDEKKWRRPTLRCWHCHPHCNVGQCEFTVHETTASTIFICAALMSEGWMPSEELRNRKPRKDAFLFGYYYMP